MGQVFVFVNQKGGVGKTTSAINIGAYLAEAGKKTLLIDFDSQANLSSGIGAIAVGKKTSRGGIYELISGKMRVQEVLQQSSMPGLWIIPASIDLSGAAVELIDEEERNFFLRNAIDSLKNDFEYVLIDCPPSLGLLTVNGLAAADAVLIPLQCEYFAMEGLSLLLQTVRRIQKGINPALKIGGLFFTMYDQRTRLAQEVVRSVTSYFHDRVFSTIIPRNVRLSEAPSHGLSINKYDPNCSGAKAYKSLAAEIIERSKALREESLKEAAHGNV
ncbi:MAG: ParA family protein [Spirochaetaceae bacterium]|jgi:chromosome partitioning protein|nr:ParA family protein [Spirochaetaceae bacterium]